MIPFHGHCDSCAADQNFDHFGEYMECRVCASRTSDLRPPQDSGEPETDADGYLVVTAAIPQPKKRPAVAWRPLMSKRHVKDFYAEGHEVFQAPPNHPNRVVYSRGDEQRVLESIGISPEDNHTPLKDDDGNDIF